MLPLTTFLSRLIGLFSVFVSISMVAHGRATVETVTALVHNPPLLLILGMIGLIAGLAIVLGHNVWSGGLLPVIVTLVGWLILIRGLLLLFLPPETVVELLGRLHFVQYFYAYVAVPFAIGAYLTYGGFSSK
ncbi:MAG: hypothetical protein ABSC63_20825 [Candidatus Binataceae bacterium]|jgi:hypothetical protein